MKTLATFENKRYPPFFDFILDAFVNNRFLPEKAKISRSVAEFQWNNPG